MPTVLNNLRRIFPALGDLCALERLDGGEPSPPETPP
jgi:hypothetical protein